MFKKGFILLCLVLLLGVCGYIESVYAQSAELTGRDIMIEVDNRPDGNDRTMTMTLINKGGKTRELTVLSFSKDYGNDSKSLIYFKNQQM